MKIIVALVLAAAGLASTAAAPPPAPPYGVSLTLREAKSVMAVAMGEAARRKTDVTVAIVDPYGEMVMLERATNAQYASTDIAALRARGAI